MRQGTYGAEKWPAPILLPSPISQHLCLGPCCVVLQAPAAWSRSMTTSRPWRSPLPSGVQPARTTPPLSAAWMRPPSRCDLLCFWTMRPLGGLGWRAAVACCGRRCVCFATLHCDTGCRALGSPCTGRPITTAAPGPHEIPCLHPCRWPHCRPSWPARPPLNHPPPLVPPLLPPAPMTTGRLGWQWLSHLWARRWWWAGPPGG